MADPIARWRNSTIKTVRQLISILPKDEMASADFRDIAEAALPGFVKTAYQTACQLGLYYEEDHIYYPRFTAEPNVEEVLDYLRNWIIEYYVPNPYTRGFDDINPISIHSELCRLLFEAKTKILWHSAKLDIFKVEIGNDDILKNIINFYSDVITVDKDRVYVNIKDGIEYADLEDYIFDLDDYDRNDKELFFNHFALDRKENKPERAVPAPVINIIPPLDDTYPHNFIIYGAPGTGKSHEVEDHASVFGSRKKRITFYPDYSYSKFVGSYKPFTYYKKAPEGTEFYYSRDQQSNNSTIQNEPVIDYSFTPGPFMQALAESFLSDEPYLLIIEEINRANAAAVFGEIFQLLDRENGTSNYKVILSEEAMYYLKDTLGERYEIIKDGIFLPANLYIWATMNSADQGVFPMDAAFKRRWSFEYLPLNANSAACDGVDIIFCGKFYSWNSFREIINGHLIANNIPEDRLIGPFFLSQKELADADSVKNKLLLYLRDDVLRHNHKKLFVDDTFSEIISQYDNGISVFVTEVTEKLEGLIISVDVPGE